MDDTLYYGALLALLVGILLAAARKIPVEGCAGSCNQGRKSCDCKEAA